MDTKVIDKTTDGAVNLAHLANEFSKAKVLVEDKLEDGKRKAERMVKHGRVAAEDFVDDTAHYIKRHPWQSVGIAAGIGAGVGMLLSLVFTLGCATARRD